MTHDPTWAELVEALPITEVSRLPVRSQRKNLCTSARSVEFSGLGLGLAIRPQDLRKMTLVTLLLWLWWAMPPYI
jgi:hypothetical protein